MSVFGDRLRALRKERDLGQKEVAAWLGLNYSTIGKYEAGGRTPNPEVIRILAEHFDCSTDYLLGRSDNRYQLFGDVQHDNTAFARTYREIQGSSDKPVSSPQPKTITIEDTPNRRLLVNTTRDFTEDELKDLATIADMFRKKRNNK